MCRSMEQFQKEILAEGRAEGQMEERRAWLCNLMKKTGKSLEEVLEFVEIPKSEWESYKKLLRQ